MPPLTAKCEMDNRTPPSNDNLETPRCVTTGMARQIPNIQPSVALRIPNSHMHRVLFHHRQRWATCLKDQSPSAGLQNRGLLTISTTVDLCLKRHLVLDKCLPPSGQKDQMINPSPHHQLAPETVPSHRASPRTSPSMYHRRHHHQSSNGEAQSLLNSGPLISISRPWISTEAKHGGRVVTTRIVERVELYPRPISHLLRSCQVRASSCSC